MELGSSYICFKSEKKMKNPKIYMHMGIRREKEVPKTDRHWREGLSNRTTNRESKADAKDSSGSGGYVRRRRRQKRDLKAKQLSLFFFFLSF